MKRIFLFLVTNLAVLALLTVVIWVVENRVGVRLGQGDRGGLLLAASCGSMRFFMSHAPLDARIAARRAAAAQEPL
jgi:hypothetical protein